MEKRNIMTKTWTVCMLAILCCFLWGSAFPCIKIGYDMFQIAPEQTSSQILFAGIRFATAGILVVLLASIAGRKPLIPRKGSWKMIAIVSIFQTLLQYFFFYVGLAHTTGVKASIIEGSHVFFSILIASLLFHQEKLNLKKAMGCIVGFSGVVLVNLTGSGLDGGLRFEGEGFLLISCVAYAFSSVLIKLFSARENPVVLSGYQFVLGGIVMIIAGVSMGGELQINTPWAYVIMLYMALISAVAYSVWGLLLKYNPVSKVTIFGFITPVFGVILSAVFLKEGTQIPWMQSIVALVLVCAGIYVVEKISAE